MDCKKCDNIISDERIHLGYDTCLKCSDTEKYASHTVYPHKTGGYIQPMSSEQADNMKRLDRRSVGGERKAKGIMADKSWDRWLEKYLSEKNKEPKPSFTPKKVISSIPHMDYHSLFNKVILHYKDNGYQNTLSYLNELYSKDKISLRSKSKVIDEINQMEILPKRLRKWVMKIK